MAASAVLWAGGSYLLRGALIVSSLAMPRSMALGC